jgi:hypothetical protein
MNKKNKYNIIKYIKLQPMADTFLTETLYKNRQTPSPSPPQYAPDKLHQESDIDKQKRLWEWTLKRISFIPPTEDFYSKYPIKPGSHKFKDNEAFIFIRHWQRAKHPFNLFQSISPKASCALTKLNFSSSPIPELAL